MAVYFLSLIHKGFFLPVLYWSFDRKLWFFKCLEVYTVSVMDEYGTLVELTLENRSPRRKTSPTATLPPQIPHGLNRDRTWAFVVRGRRLTA
jgi:hypothetical protein